MQRLDRNAIGRVMGNGVVRRRLVEEYDVLNRDCPAQEKVYEHVEIAEAN